MKKTATIWKEIVESLHGAKALGNLAGDSIAISESQLLRNRKTLGENQVAVYVALDDTQRETNGLDVDEETQACCLAGEDLSKISIFPHEFTVALDYLRRCGSPDADSWENVEKRLGYEGAIFDALDGLSSSNIFDLEISAVERPEPLTDEVPDNRECVRIIFRLIVREKVSRSRRCLA